jgi:hypothetical protein
MSTQNPKPTSADNIPFDEIVTKLIPDPANNISYSIIYGLIGKSANENCIRVYFNESLSKYADIPKESIKHYETASSLSDKVKSRKCKLWVISDAKVELQSYKSHNSIAVKFLSGNIYRFQTTNSRGKNRYIAETDSGCGIPTDECTQGCTETSGQCPITWDCTPQSDSCPSDDCLGGRKSPAGSRSTEHEYCSTNYVDCGPQPSDSCTHSSSCGEATGSCSNYCTAGRCSPTHGCYDANQRNRGTDYEYCSTSYIVCGPQPSDDCTHSSSCEPTGSCSNYCTAGRCYPTHGCYGANQRNRGTDYEYCSTNYIVCGPQPSDDCTHSSSCGEATGSCSNYCTAGRCSPTHGGCYNPKQNWPKKQRYNSTFSPYNCR